MTAQKNDNGDLFAAIVVATLLFLCATCAGCSTTKCIPEKVEVHDTVVHHDSVYVERVRDSIVFRDRKDSTYVYEKDSVSERQRGDTVYITKWRVKYQYIVQKSDAQTITSTKHESVSEKEDKEKSSSAQVHVKRERYVPNFYKLTMWFFWIVIAVLVGWLVWWLADYIPALGTAKNWLKLLFKIK